MGSVRTRSVMDYFRHNFSLFSKTKGTEYQSSKFWDQMYLKSTFKTYEWGCQPSDLLVYNYHSARRFGGMAMTATLSQTLALSNSNRSVLVIGAGSSKIGEMCYENNYKPVIQSDFSQVIVNKNKEADQKYYPNIRWEYADARESLKHLLGPLQEKLSDHEKEKGEEKKCEEDEEEEDGEERLFGTVIDKGLIDAVYLANDNCYSDITKIVSNVVDVLDPDCGVFLTFSRSHPDYLEPFLKNSGFISIEARRLESPDIYLYRLCKGEESLVHY